MHLSLCPFRMVVFQNTLLILRLNISVTTINKKQKSYNSYCKRKYRYLCSKTFLPQRKIKTFVYKQKCLSNCTNKNVNHNPKHRITFVFQNILAANTDICVHSKKAKGQSKVQWIYSLMDPSFDGSKVWRIHRAMNPWVDPRYNGDKVRWSQGSMDPSNLRLACILEVCFYTSSTHTQVGPGCWSNYVHGG